MVKSKLVVGIFTAWSILACSLWGVASSWFGISTVAYLVALVASCVALLRLGKKWERMKNEG